jgi:tetratricopeptide (TPR) repeat protein
MRKAYFKGERSMQEPQTPEDVFALHDLRRSNLQRYLEIVNEWLQKNPRNFRAYFRRHYAWDDMGEPQRALDDLTKVIQLAPNQAAFCARGRIYRQLGEHENALANFRRGEATNPKEWANQAITLLYQADSYARVGDAASALACCERLPNDFWTPGFDGAPGGGKAEIAAELRRIAADARSRRA